MGALDWIVLLVALAFGIPTVGALLWSSYGPGGVYWRERRVTSSGEGVPAAGTNGRSRHSAAVEQDRNEWEQGDGNTGSLAVPGSLVARVETMPDNELFGMLALLTDDDGEWRFSDSRLARFAGGRVADRLEQIRELREGVRPSAPPEPKRAIPMRHNGSERLVPLE